MLRCGRSLLSSGRAHVPSTTRRYGGCGTFRPPLLQPRADMQCPDNPCPRVSFFLQIGKHHLTLIEGPTKHSTPEQPLVLGRTHNSKRCILPATLPDGTPLLPGDFVGVSVQSATAASLRGVPTAKTTIEEWYRKERGVQGSGDPH